MLNLKILATGSKGNCYLLNDDSKVLILDAGLPVQNIRRGLNYDTRNVVGCFVSHGHKDHMMGVEGLRIMGIPIFEPYKSEMERRVVNYDGFVLKSFPLPHDESENRGVFVTCPDGHRLLYLTDYEYCSFTFKAQAINTLLIECNYCKSMIDPEEEKYNHVLRGHASLDVVKEFIKVNRTPDLRNVILCHLSYTSADEVEIMQEITGMVNPDVNVTVAHKDLTFKLTE